MSKTPDLAGTRVLVIDDCEVIHHCARASLVPAGCEVFVSKNGFNALVDIADRDPHLILMDALMPRLDGYKTCSLIRRNARYAHIPVIMLSAKDSMFDLIRGRIAGATHYVTKPFSKKTLLQAVSEHLRPIVEPRRDLSLFAS